MKPFKTHDGLAAVLKAQHVDTDQIIPKQFLKRIERTGFGQFLFFDWRFQADGKTPNAEFSLNQPRYKGASVLLALDNFGCGSSREHAPWSLQDYGFQVIVAPSFADIFFNNCFKNGMLPIVLPRATVDQLIADVEANPGATLAIDLEKQKLTLSTGRSLDFPVDPYRKHLLLEGLDDIGLTLLHQDKITVYEAAHSHKQSS